MQKLVTLTQAECLVVRNALQLAIELYTKNQAFCVDVEQPLLAHNFAKQVEEARRIQKQMEEAQT